MRIALYIGAFLLCVTFGASVSMIFLQAPPPAAPTAVPVPVPPEDGLVHRVVANARMRVPLPAGFCALDPANAADRATQARLMPIGSASTVDNTVLALSCDRRAQADRSPMAPNMRLLAVGALKADGRNTERVEIPRAAFLTRLRDRAGQLGADGIARTDASSGSARTLRAAGEDTNAHYFRLNARNAEVSSSEVCGIMAVTVASRIAVVLTLIENCATAAVDGDMLPEAGELAARIVALNR